MKCTIRVYDEDPSSTHHLGHDRPTNNDSAHAAFGAEPIRHTSVADNKHIPSFEYVYDAENDDENSATALLATASPSSLFLPGHYYSTTTAAAVMTNPDKSTFAPHRNALKYLQRIFVQLFLPLGYPHSVDPTYLPYQIYDAIQGLCSYLRGVVSTSAVLKTVGVGDDSTTAMSAAMAWALRDGVGMVGGLLFSFVASDAFDTHVKEWRLFADVINDVALTLDMLAPHVAAVFSSSNNNSGSTAGMVILCASTICKTMCGMSAGATKGRITQHFAVKGNMADLTAKESTQETLVSLLGMIGGILLAHLLRPNSNNDDTTGSDKSRGNDLFWMWMVFTTLTAVLDQG